MSWGGYIPGSLVREIIERDAGRDCGVPAGCGACPLGRAGVCGYPVPGDDGAGLDQDAPDVDPAEPRPAGAGCCGGCRS